MWLFSLKRPNVFTYIFLLHFFEYKDIHIFTKEKSVQKYLIEFYNKLNPSSKIETMKGLNVSIKKIMNQKIESKKELKTKNSLGDKLKLSRLNEKRKLPISSNHT